MVPDVSSGAARVDARAAARALARLARAAEPPWLNQEAARRMAERLDWIKARPTQVLDWSGPAGASGEPLSGVYPRALHWRVDEMPAQAAHHATMPWWRRWSSAAAAHRVVRAADVQPASAGLVWSNMRLHFEPDPEPLLNAWRAALAPDGFLMFSTLGPGSLGLLRDVYEASGWGVPHAPFVDMHDLGDMLVAHGFAEPVMDQETLTLTYASPDDLLAELRGLGGNFAPRRFAGLRTPRWHAALRARLAECAGPDGRLALQVELVYGHAFRAADAGPRVEPQTRIQLSDMKLMLRKIRRDK
jgi:malonyl-CoA O-methyltransferase